MRAKFRGYFEPTETEFEEIWASATVILDTNALLNLYRYTLATRNMLLSVLETMRDRLWLPNQVAMEYHKRRLGVISDQGQAYEAVKDLVNKHINSAVRDLGTHRIHSALEVEGLRRRLAQVASSISAEMDEAARKHADIAPASVRNDPVLSSLDELFANRVGDPFSEQDLVDLHAEGRARYENKIPPGFTDHKKPEPECFGDFILWRQILLHARETGKPAIFVTDDLKEDWWRVHRGERFGPRPELVDEYYQAANALVVFYRPDEFASIAYNRVDGPQGSPSITEIRDVSNDSQTKYRLTDLMIETGRVQSIVDRLENRRHEYLESSRHEAMLRHEEQRLLERYDILHKVRGEILASTSRSSNEDTRLVEIQAEMDSLQAAQRDRAAMLAMEMHRQSELIHTETELAEARERLVHLHREIESLIE